MSLADAAHALAFKRAETACDGKALKGEPHVFLREHFAEQPAEDVHDFFVDVFARERNW